MYTKIWQRLWCDYLGKQIWRAHDTESHVPLYRKSWAKSLVLVLAFWWTWSLGCGFAFCFFVVILPVFPPPVGNPECLNDKISAHQSTCCKTADLLTGSVELRKKLSTFSCASNVWSLVFPSCRLAATPQRQSLQCQLCSCNLSTVMH